MSNHINPVNCLPRTHAPRRKPATGGGVAKKPVAPRHELQPTPKPHAFADRPLFGLTNQIGQTVQHPKHPADTLGVVVMPVAVAVDIVDLFTRPLQALFIR